MSPAPFLYRSSLTTPVGPMVALYTDQALCALEFELESRISLLEARLARFYGSPRLLPHDPGCAGAEAILGRIREWLAGYFVGRFQPVPVPLELRGTPFEQRVWAMLLTIPTGTRATYGQLAARLGVPSAARAVGGASRRNPISLLVPCHRVVGHSGSLTGYGGGLALKEWLLRHEAAPGLASAPSLSLAG